MKKNIGFIGCGNMGKAMLNGLLNSNYTSVENIMVSTRSEESKNSILNQAAQAMLAQANQQPQAVLNLLRG